MATRSNSGMGVLVALVIFIMLTVILLLMLMLFYTKADRAVRDQEAAEAAVREFVRDTERTRDDVQRMVSSARADGKSVVVWQRDQFQGLMRLVAGSPGLTMTQLQARLAQLGVQEGEALANVLTEMRTKLRDTEQRLEALDRELAAAHARAQDESEQRQRDLDSHRTTIAALNNEIARIQQMADRYAGQVGEAEQNMEQRVRDIRNRYEEQVASLTEAMERRDASIAQLEDTVQSLQARLQPPSIHDEGSLVDGQIIRLLGNNDVIIDLGRRNRAALGMTFNVYGSTTELRPDATGQIAPGKGTIEITRLNDTTSTARIIRTTPGRAIVEGDILVNPIFDRHKTYSFYVFGRFDLDGEGPSDLETDIVKARIREWGGTLRDGFAGDIDFLVLGVEPTMPMPLRSGATPAEINRHIRERRFYENYQDYLDKARRLRIPVLNQNRLMTLIGYYGN